MRLPSFAQRWDSQSERSPAVRWAVARRTAAEGLGPRTTALPAEMLQGVDRSA